MLHVAQKKGVPKVEQPAPENFTKCKLTKYHYIRPIFQSTVALAAVFTVAGLVHILDDDSKKKNPANRVTEYSIIAMNILILGCWRIKGLQHFMKTYFMHRVELERPITLLTACFSHRIVTFHFIPNMALLYYYFGPVRELSDGYEVVAVYLSSGIFGFAASHVNRLAQYRILNRKLVPSMGSSGALMGIMAVAHSWLDRDTHLAKVGVVRDVFVFQVASDVVGIICRWRAIDFAAHLGGATFGYFYSIYGRDYIWHPLVSSLQKLLHNE